MARTRISFLSVPVDVVEPNELGSEIMNIVHSGDYSQVCFVSIWDILRARTNPEYLNCLKKASLILPVSKSIVRGSAFLKLQFLSVIIRSLQSSVFSGSWIKISAPYICLADEKKH